MANPTLRQLEEEQKRIETPDVYQLPQDIQDHVRKIFPNLPSPKPMPEIPNAAPPADMSNLENPEDEGMLSQEIPDPMDEAQMEEILQNRPAQVNQATQARQQPSPNVPNRIPSANQVSDIDSIIARQNEEEDRNSLWKAGSKFAASIAGAGAGRIVKPDLSMYDDLQKKAERPLKNLQLKQELEDKKAHDDPNSELSKLTRSSLEELGMSMEGMENVSYSQIAKLYPTLAQSLQTRINAKAAVAKAQIESEAQKQKILETKQENEQERERKRLEMENDNRQKDLDRKLKQQENVISSGIKADIAAVKKGNEDFNKNIKVSNFIGSAVERMRKSKPAIAYSNASSTRQMIEAALNDKDSEGKVAKAAAAMGYFKSAQGDDSVVKSEDMKVLLGGFDATSVRDMLKKIESKLQGSPVSDIELGQMLQVIKRIEDIKKRTLNTEYVIPIEKAADKFGYDLIEMSPEFRQEVKNYEPSIAEKKQMMANRAKEIANRKKELEAKGSKQYGINSRRATRIRST